MTKTARAATLSALKFAPATPVLVEDMQAAIENANYAAQANPERHGMVDAHGKYTSNRFVFPVAGAGYVQRLAWFFRLDVDSQALIFRAETWIKDPQGGPTTLDVQLQVDGVVMATLTFNGADSLGYDPSCGPYPGPYTLPYLPPDHGTLRSVTFAVSGLNPGTGPYASGVAGEHLATVWLRQNNNGGVLDAVGYLRHASLGDDTLTMASVPSPTP